MQHLIVLVRDIDDPAEEANFRRMAANDEPHTWATFYPFRDQVNQGIKDAKYHFHVGEVLVIEDNGQVVMGCLINLRNGLLKPPHMLGLANDNP